MTTPTPWRWVRSWARQAYRSTRRWCPCGARVGRRLNPTVLIGFRIVGDVGETRSTGFSREAFETLPARRDGNGFVGQLRDRAFGEFEAMPMPSPETEE